MNFTKEIKITKTVIDYSKIKIGDKVLFKSRCFYNEDMKDLWDYECDGYIMTIGEDYITIRDLDYPEYAYDVTAEELANGMYVSVEIIK